MKSVPAPPPCTDTIDVHQEAPRADREPARRGCLRNDDSELLLESDLPLRPDPLHESGPYHDRCLPAEHGRQGPLQEALLLRARARAGPVRAALLRRAEPRQRGIVDARARGPTEPPWRRD